MIAKNIDLGSIATEQRNHKSEHIDDMSSLEIALLMNDEDQKVAPAVRKAINEIAKSIDVISDRLRHGGRLFYAGAGTSGRLGILDASECPPTFGTDPELVQGLIAGGHEAVFRAKEGAEDSESLGAEDLASHSFSKRDVLVGLAASGRTPYVIGCMRHAQEKGGAAIAVSCSPSSPIGLIADIDITVLPGPEIITGSTRLKAGTAEKMVLNMLSTGTMIRLGKTYGNLMVDVRATNDKLKARSLRIVMEATGCTRNEAVSALKKSSGSARLAIFMLLSNLSADMAGKRLDEAGGRIADALKMIDTGKARQR